MLDGKDCIGLINTDTLRVPRYEHEEDLFFRREAIRHPAKLVECSKRRWSAGNSRKATISFGNDFFTAEQRS